MNFGTLCTHELPQRDEVHSHQLPIYATSSFDFANIQEGIDTFLGKKDLHFYSRYGNPTVEAVANKIALMEAFGTSIEAVGIMTSSGMSAIATLMIAVLRPGDKILTQGNLYGGTTELFTKILEPYGIGCILTDLQDLDNVESHLKADSAIKMLYFETPANPTLACVDIEALTALAQQYDARTTVDNTFCTPYIQQPLRFGVDFVIHSTTKYLNGHGNSIAGVIVGRNADFMHKEVWKVMKLMGTNCSPFEAWLTGNGLKTLELRMERHSSNAMALAEYLQKHPRVERVNYCGLPSHPDHLIARKQMKLFSGMLSFELKGGLEAGKAFMDAVKLCTIAPTLGDVDTLILHPASMSHLNIPREIRERNGITDGLIRLSVGIENIEDLIQDVELGMRNEHKPI